MQNQTDYLNFFLTKQSDNDIEIDCLNGKLFVNKQWLSTAL